MIETHTIKTAQLEIDFNDEHLSDEFQQEAGNFFIHRLMPVVEEVFDEAVGKLDVVLLERLEVDLGQVKSTGFQQEMETRLRTKLWEVLMKHLKSLETETPTAIRRNEQLSQLEHVLYYLSRGHLSWNTQLGPGQTMETLFLEALIPPPNASSTTHSTPLLEFLRKNRSRPNMLRRIVTQFSKSTRLTLVRALIGDHHPFLHALVEDLLKIDIFRKRTGLSVNQLETQLWVALLSELLYLGAELARPVALLERVIQQFCLLSESPQTLEFLLADLMRPESLSKASPGVARVFQQMEVPLPVCLPVRSIRNPSTCSSDCRRCSLREPQTS